MDRLQFLKKAERLAYEQIGMSSCLTDREFAELSEMEEETALYTKAKQILADAAFEVDIP